MARRRALCTAALAAVAALVVSAAPVQAAAPSYVALGDSYSSGTGTRRACSGAKIADVTNTQLSALSSSTSYVTISIGGNDAGFASVLTTCAQPAWLSNCNGAIDKAQAFLNKRTGGKFGSIIGKGGDFVEDKIGLPEDKPAGDKAPAPTDAGQPAPRPEDAAPAPTPDSAPSQRGQSDSTGGGVLPG